MRQVEVKGCKLTNLPLKGDDRGTLVAIESGNQVKFDIARVYFVFDTKLGVDRGFHAHRSLRQFLIAVSGSCTICIDDGATRENVRLGHPSLALSIEGLVWREMRDFSSDCVLLVLADCVYVETDYIRDHTEFLAAVAERAV